MSNKASNNYPNKVFIKYLRSYCPVREGTSLQFEVMQKNTELNNLEPLKFELARQSQYKEELKSLVQNRESAVVFLSGVAGDGKTSLLHDICLDENIFGLNEDIWGDAISSHVVLDIDVDDINEYKKLKIEDLDTELPEYLAHEVHLKHRNITLCVIKDMSEIINKRDLLRIFTMLCKIYERVKKANNHVSSAIPEIQGNCTAVIDERDELVLKNMSLHNKDHAIYLLVAGNNGKLLEKLNLFEKLVEENGHKFNCFESSTIDSIKKLAKSLESHMIMHQPLHSDFCKIFSMSECLNRDSVEKIFNEFLNCKHWDGCLGCQWKDSCQILLNRKILNNHNVIRHFSDLFELSNDDGYHITMRNLLLLMSNAILGRRGANQSYLYSCNTAVKRENKEVTRISPFDSLFGLNYVSGSWLKAIYYNEFDQRSSPKYPIDIFKQLSSLRVGNVNNKAIDNLITYGCSNIDGEGAAFDTDIAQVCMRLIKENDNSYVYEGIQRRLDYLFGGHDENYKDERPRKNKELQGLYASIRRTLFFTLDKANDQAVHDSSIFSSYSLTAFKYGYSYLQLKKLVNGNKDFDSRAVDDVKRQLFIGLNRACTSLPTVKYMDKLFISLNNRINPVDLCIIPDEDHFRLNIDLTDSNYFNVVRLVSSEFINNNEKIPTIVFFASKDEAQKKQEKSYNNKLFVDIIKMRLDQDTYNLITNYALNYDRFKSFIENNKSLNFYSMDEASLFEEFYKYLAKINEILQDDMDPEEKRFLNLLSSIYNDPNLSPSSRTVDGVEPLVVASLILRPSMFEFLMSLGDGVSTVSFENELSESIIRFKAEIEKFQLMVKASTTKNALTDMKFCRLNDEGAISY